jgi:hypothetical protein
LALLVCFSVADGFLAKIRQNRHSCDAGQVLCGGIVNWIGSKAMIYILFSRLSAVCAIAAMLFMGLHASNITPAAHAQPANCDDHPACRASMPTGNVCRLYLNAGNGSQSFGEQSLDRIEGRASRSWPQRCYRGSRVFGLAGFRLNTRGGHKVKNFGFLHGRDSVEFWLEDKNSDDFSDGFVWLTGMPEGTEERFVIRRNCRGECILRLEREDTTREIFLSGFKFSRKDGDGHVKRIAILPLQNEGSVYPRYMVAFQDDDFEYEVRLQYVLVPRNTFGPLLEVAKTYDANNDGRMTRGEREPVHSDLIAVRQQGNIALRGFEFKFSNGGHFIEDIGVEPDQTAFQAWFQDNQSDDDRREPDDPLEWRVLYSRIHY